jgi:hypothetical protein
MYFVPMHALSSPRGYFMFTKEFVMTPNPSKPKCFVIRPIHNRSDFIQDLYVNPACQEAFDVIPAGTEATASTITEEIFQHLDEDLLVLAYLGSPARMEGEGNKWFWNPNVMLEAGYRLGLNKPIVFMRDHRQSEAEPMLPFDLANVQVIELPTEQEERGERMYRDRTIAQIKQFADVVVKVWKATTDRDNEKDRPAFAWPAITMAFDAHSRRVTAASDDAAKLFGFATDENLVGIALTTLLDKIMSRMMPAQREAFKDEQARLIGEIAMGEKPVATVCLVFANQDIPPGGKVEAAHLPIVAGWQARGGITSLNVLYMDVTKTASIDEDGVVRPWPQK